MWSSWAFTKTTFRRANAEKTAGPHCRFGKPAPSSPSLTSAGSSWHPSQHSHRRERQTCLSKWEKPQFWQASLYWGHSRYHILLLQEKGQVSFLYSPLMVKRENIKGLFKMAKIQLCLKQFPIKQIAKALPRWGNFLTVQWRNGW